MERRKFLKNGIGAAAAGAFIPSALRGTQGGNLPGVNSENEHSYMPAGDDYELYNGQNRVRSGICHGGIGTGGIELRKDGQFYNWSIFNNLPRGIAPPAVLKNHIADGYDINRQDNYLTFIARYHEKGKDPKMKLLRLIDNLEIPGSGIYGIPYIFPWMTPVENIRYKAKFPYSWLEFSDSEMPFKVKMEVFSPFIPQDLKNSSLPGIYFNFEILPDEHADVDVTILALQQNLTGYHTTEKYFITDITSENDLTFISMGANMDSRYPTAGKTGIGTTSPNASWYAGWALLHPFFEAALRNKDLPNLDDTNGTFGIKGNIPGWMPETNGRNYTDPATGQKKAYGEPGEQALFSTLAASFNLEDRKPLRTTFMLTWYYPNQYHNSDAFDQLESGKADPKLEWCGHYFLNSFDSDLEVARYLVNEQEALSRKTRAFLDDLYASNIDGFVLDQINSQLNTMITNSFLDKKGVFTMADDGGLTYHKRTPTGSLNPDVNIYASVLYASLFPELYESALRGMTKFQRPNGAIMSDRSDWPSDMILMIDRHFAWTGDRKFLEDMWPAMQKVAGFALDVLDQDGDKVPEIYAHNNGCTFDNLPMYGVAAYIVSLWIAALNAMIRSAEVLDDKKAAGKYRKLLTTAVKVREKELWNGSYYDLSSDKLQGHGVNEGCLTDQLFGQWLMHQSGLGEQVEKERRDQVLKIILDRNFRKDFLLKNCSYPGEPFYGTIRKNVWNDQDNTPWSGVELAFASFLFYEGFYDEGLQVIKTVDDRYRKAGLYFNHIEAMGHYCRPMSAWGILNGLLGLSITPGKLSFKPCIPGNNYRVFFAIPGATCHFTRNDDGYSVRVLTGSLSGRKVVIKEDEGMEKEIRVV